MAQARCLEALQREWGECRMMSLQWRQTVVAQICRMLGGHRGVLEPVALSVLSTGRDAKRGQMS